MAEEIYGKQQKTLSTIKESVDFGDLKKELSNNRKVVKDIEQPAKTRGAVEIGNSKNQSAKRK